MQLKRAEPGDRVTQVLCPAQDREHILDVRGFEGDGDSLLAVMRPPQRYLREANVLRPPKLEHPV